MRRCSFFIQTIFTELTSYNGNTSIYGGNYVNTDTVSKSVSETVSINSGINIKDKHANFKYRKMGLIP